MFPLVELSAGSRFQLWQGRLREFSRLVDDEGRNPPRLHARQRALLVRQPVLHALDQADLHVELCSECHPFYTGKQKLVDTGGRVERFQRRAAKHAKAGR